MRWVGYVILTAWMSMVLFVAGCGGDAGNNEINTNNGIKNETETVNNELPAEPIKIGVFQHSARLTDEEFNEFFVEPVKEKYPHITMELVRSGNDNTPENLVASGALPDLIYTGVAGMKPFLDLKALEDLHTYTRKNQFDLDKLDPTFVQLSHQFGSNGELYALPMSINFSVLYYNKDIFEKFGLSYPQDGMNWDEAIELGKRMTRVEDEIQYVGIDIGDGDGNLSRFVEQASLATVDARTNKAMFATDPILKLLQLYKSILETPGYKQPYNFREIRNLAMVVHYGALLASLEELHLQGNPVHYDLASTPFLQENPNKGLATNAFLLGMSPTSRYKDEAFDVITLIMGEEMQSKLNQRGKLSVLTDPKVRMSFGSSIQSLEDKNINSIINYQAAPRPPYNEFSATVIPDLNKALIRVMNENIDPNTALREAEENANQLIQEEMNRKQ